MLIGTFYNKIDEKGRLRMPAKLKDGLGGGYFLTRGDSGCLYGMSRETFEKLAEKLQTISFSDNEAKKMTRLLYSSAHLAEEDNQGRFLLPQNLREFAGITKEAVIIGNGDRVEIWSGENWKNYSESGDYDSLIAGLAKYDL